MRVASCVAALALLCQGSSFAQSPNLLANPSFFRGMDGWSVEQNETCRSAIVHLPDRPFLRALRLTLRPAPDSTPWAIKLHQPVDASIAGGHRLQAKVWLRSPDSCKTTVYCEVSREPYTKSLAAVLTLSPEWTEYTIEGKALQDFAPGEASFGFHLAYGPGSVEIANVRLIDLDAPPGPEGERPTVDKPASLIQNGDFTQPLDGNWAGVDDRLKVTVHDGDVGGFTKIVRLECTPPENAQPWDVSFGQPCTGPVRTGDAVYFRAWLRSPDNCQVGFIYEMATPPHTKSIEQKARLTPEWQEWRFMGRAGQSFQPGEHQAKFFLGYDKGVVEMAGVRVENCGEAPDSAFDQTIDYWGGREHPDTWREPALQRIERLRKGDLKVIVRDAAGKPVPNATVHVDQQRHLFKFGVAGPAARLVDIINPDNLRYQQEVARLFNTFTFENDLKWASANIPTVDRAVEWLVAHDMNVRGHCLLWGSYQHLPQPTRDLRGAELLEAMQTHVTDFAERMRGKLYLWDVVNEAGSNTEVWDEVGWEAFADSFRWAKAADPDVRLCYNDYGIINENPGYRAQVSKRIQYLLDHNVPVDALGIQGHMNTPLTPITRVLEILDEWAAFGKDLEITEFDLGLWDDKVHAEYLKDVMLAMFSHPRMTAFIQWGFWEGSHWRAKDGAALFARDWSKRAALDAYEDLVFRQWWTKWEGKTGQDGTAALRAFYGKQKVTVQVGEARGTATVELRPGREGEAEVRMR